MCNYSDEVVADIRLFCPTLITDVRPGLPESRLPNTSSACQRYQTEGCSNFESMSTMKAQDLRHEACLGDVPDDVSFATCVCQSTPARSAAGGNWAGLVILTSLIWPYNNGAKAASAWHRLCHRGSVVSCRILCNSCHNATKVYIVYPAIHGQA